MKDIYILGIESSCDETSMSIVKNGREVLSNVISSQIDIHKIYGGVVPEIASRKHIDNINYVFDEAMKKSKMSIWDIDGIAVTYGPGLVGALLVGLSYAKALSLSSNKKLIAVNHIEGHIAANYITSKELKPPFLALIVSGGHTNLVLVEDYLKFKIYGSTRDDAVGESFDKVARSLGLSYPGGPKIEEKAQFGEKDKYIFPRANIKEAPFDFSFSGLKSSVINTINSLKQNYISENKLYNKTVKDVILDNQSICDISKAFQDSIIDTLVSKTVELANHLDIKNVAICGGVSANKTICKALSDELNKSDKKLFCPEFKYCTDNAAMIASAGYFRYLHKDFADMSINADANLKFEGN